MFRVVTDCVTLLNDADVVFVESRVKFKFLSSLIEGDVVFTVFGFVLSLDEVGIVDGLTGVVFVSALIFTVAEIVFVGSKVTFTFMFSLTDANVLFVVSGVVFGFVILASVTGP